MGIFMKLNYVYQRESAHVLVHFRRAHFCTASACIVCRNMEISFETHKLLWKFVYESEASRLAASAATLLPVMREGLQLALQQENHRTTKYTTIWAAENYLQLVGQMCVAQHVCGEVVLRWNPPARCHRAHK